MAGKGQRFKDAGYKRYKAFLPVDGKPMLRVALENLNMFGMEHTYVFICNHDDVNHVYNLTREMGTILNGHYLYLPERARGAAEACYMINRMAHLNLNEPCIVANCDQIIDWDSNKFLDYCDFTQCHGCVATFEATSPQHSYAKVLGKTHVVDEVKEKQVISTHALCGVHYWKTTELAMYSFGASLLGPPHYNGDYYIAPTYNELIKRNYSVLIYPTQGMTVLGTPEQYEEYIESSSSD